MSHLCLIPAKRLGRAKARLAPDLDVGERRALTLAMLGDVIAVARPVIETWVVCSDPEVRELAARLGAAAFPDPTPDAGLNPSLDAVTKSVRQFEGALILASDLPCIAEEDVAAMLVETPVGIAPSRDGRGTNALWRSPPGVIEPAFGDRSRATHEERAASAGVPFTLVERPCLALDVDRPADLRAALDLGAGPETTPVLQRLIRSLRA